MSAIVTVQEVHKSFSGKSVLRGVSMALQDGDRVALVGLNGSGKSTLLRLIVRDPSEAAGSNPSDDQDEDDNQPDSGLITRRRGLRVGFVPQEPKLPKDQSIADFLWSCLGEYNKVRIRLEEIEKAIPGLQGDRLTLALSEQAALHEKLDQQHGWDPEHEIRGLSHALHVPEATSLIGQLSIGERRRVALVGALLSHPDLLILDEPTNHLDARTISLLEERLLSYVGTLLLVTHDRYFLDRVATRILELDRGQIYPYEGGYRRFLEKQEERLQAEATQHKERASFVKRELGWIRAGTPARTTKQKARIDRFEEAKSAVESAEKRRGEGDLSLRLPMAQRLGKTILELHDIGKSVSSKVLFRKLSLVLKPGDRIGVVGENGAGKTTFLRVLTGQQPPDEGEIVVGQNTRFSLLDQGRADLNEEKSVLEEVSGDGDFVHLPDGKLHVRSFLRRMLFDDRFADTKVSTLSGGERNRVQLAKLLRQGGNVILLDEPTNDLDLFTLAVLEEALCEFPGCAIVVSHDRWFLDRVATAILAFEGGGQVTFHEGNYSAYLERVQEAAKDTAKGSKGVDKQQKAPDKDAAKEPPKDPGKEPDKTRPRKLSFKEQKELEGIEAAISAAEARVTQLEAALSDPALYKERGHEVATLTVELLTARKDVDVLYQRWQDLESRA